MYTGLKFYFSGRDSVYINIYWLDCVDFCLCQKHVFATICHINTPHSQNDSRTGFSGGSIGS